MNLLNTLWQGIRATVFWIGCIGYAIVHGVLAPIYYFLPYKLRYQLIFSWSRFSIWWLKVTCGVKYDIAGLENLKQEKAHILLSNHQSTWETMAIGTFPVNISWVFKRELMRVPVFGWSAALTKPIPINRGAGRSAVEQIKKLGKERLDAGIWIIIFPEGTRTAPDKKSRYKMGGAILAAHSGYSVIPVAHNAGYYWPKHSYIKKPGTIKVSIGQPIPIEGKPPEQINKEVEQWIEAEKIKLGR